VILPPLNQLVVVPQQPVLHATVLPSLRVAVALIWTSQSSGMVAELGAMAMLETVLLLITVMLTGGLLPAVTVQDKSAPHLAIWGAITKPGLIMLIVHMPDIDHVMIWPQQLTLQTVVLPSLIVATAYSWTEPPDGMVADGGRMAMLETVLLLVTIMSETLLNMPVLFAITMPYPVPHPGI
jgi:hypothetical protein